MGLFDSVLVTHNRAFVCSEGHFVDGFQTKSLECLFDMYTIHGRKFELSSDRQGAVERDGPPVTGTVCMYTSCDQCPVYVVPNGNVIDVWVEFEVVVVRGIVKKVTRTSLATADWFREELKKDYMREAVGPLAHSMASRLSFRLR